MCTMYIKKEASTNESTLPHHNFNCDVSAELTHGHVDTIKDTYIQYSNKGHSFKHNFFILEEFISLNWPVNQARI